MWSRELTEASRMAREAGRILLRMYGQNVAVEYKGAGKSDPVTEADRRANAYLVAELRRLFPDDGVVAEETADLSDALRRGRCWYVDPLDGTKEFLAENGEFSVMLGLAVHGEAKVGVVYQPVLDKLYCGAVGEQATLEQEGRVRTLRVRDEERPQELTLVVSRSHRSRKIDAVVERLGIRNEVQSGSVGLKIGMIAEQRADVYVHLSDKSCAWDACGPEAIVRAAGGRFVDLAGEPFRYGGTDVRNRRGILACSAAAFHAVLPTVREAAAAAGLAS